MNCSSHSDQRLLYLTFDDGPHPQTPNVLDVLKETGVKATFFVNNIHLEETGMHYDGALTEEQSQANQASLARIVIDGHKLADHSYNHISLDKPPADCAPRCMNPPAEWYTEVHNPPAHCYTKCTNAPKSRRIVTLGATMRRRIVAPRCTIPPADCYTKCTMRRRFVETVKGLGVGV